MSACIHIAPNLSAIYIYIYILVYIKTLINSYGNISNNMHKYIIKSRSF